MDTRTYATVTMLVFGLIALFHLGRILTSSEVTLAGMVIPLWLSWIGLAIAGFLSYSAYKIRSSMS